MSTARELHEIVAGRPSFVSVTEAVQYLLAREAEREATPPVVDVKDRGFIESYRAGNFAWAHEHNYSDPLPCEQSKGMAREWYAKVPGYGPTEGGNVGAGEVGSDLCLANTDACRIGGAWLSSHGMDVVGGYLTRAAARADASKVGIR